MMPRLSLRPVLFAAALLAPLLFGAPVAAQSGAVSEYAVKSTLLFRLPLFVYRQGERNPAFGMCVVGNNPFGGALERLAQEPIQGRPVKVMRLADAGDAAECDLVFISRSEAGGLEAVLRRLNRPSVVTVSDIEGFARAGGMVELALGDGGGVSILVNRKAAQRHSVEFNAQLLRLARVIEP
jgi:hypothetical protein